MQRRFPPTIFDLAFEYLLISNMNYSTTHTTEHSRYFCSLFKCVSKNASKTADHRWRSEEQTDVYVNHVNSTTKLFSPLQSYIAVYLSTSVGDIVSVSTLTSHHVSSALWEIKPLNCFHWTFRGESWNRSAVTFVWDSALLGMGGYVWGVLCLWPLHHHKPSPQGLAFPHYITTCFFSQTLRQSM